MRCLQSIAPREPVTDYEKNTTTFGCRSHQQSRCARLGTAMAPADAMVSDPGALRKRAHGEHGDKSSPTASTSGQDEKAPLEEETLRFSLGSMAGVFLCAAGILGPLVLYGILQERIMTRPYGEPWCLVPASLLLFPLETPSRTDDKRHPPLPFLGRRAWPGRRLLQALPAHRAPEPVADVSRCAGDPLGQEGENPPTRPDLRLRLGVLLQCRGHVLPVRGPQVSPPLFCIPRPANQVSLTYAPTFPFPSRQLQGTSASLCRRWRRPRRRSP